MNSIDQIETFVMTATQLQLINYMKQQKYLHSEFRCLECGFVCEFTENERKKDGYEWTCVNANCEFCNDTFSLRTGTFFEGFNLSFAYFFRILLKYAARVPQHAMLEGLDVSKPTLTKIMNRLKKRMPEKSYGETKLGTGGLLVQVDETMMNYSCKSHKGRPPENYTDSISIVEIDGGITRCYAQVIDNKQSATLVPIIVENVVNGATIHTDEHRSYACLPTFGYTHGTVCHKYEFVNALTGVDTQAVESFHSVLKYWIKERKGVLTEHRPMFLREFCFYYNNRGKYLTKIFELIKIH